MALLTIADLLAKRSLDTQYKDLAQALNGMYEEFLDNEEGDARERPPGLHASEISGCPRKAVYTLSNTEKREKTETHMSMRVWKRRFKIGHKVHDMFQEDFERMARAKGLHQFLQRGYRIAFKKEVTVNPTKGMYYASKWDIYSHCDGVFVIYDHEDNALVRVALEIKTMSPDDFEKTNKPKPEHIEQAHVYMACIDVPFAWFLYYNKGNQNYTGSDNPSFFVTFDEKLWATLEARFEMFHMHAAMRTLPDREEGIVCEFCPYAHTCKPKYLARKQGFHMPNPKMMVKP
jgi:CRISPR/Cas system-associated exonuclease Cas4 (RecB family)